jgi:hypothetical protein
MINRNGMRRNILFIFISIIISILISILSAEIFLRFQNSVQLDNFVDNSTWNSTLHHGSKKFAIKDIGSNCNAGKLKILLLGDSWMEDENLSNTIGQELAKRSNKCVEIINGGRSSYSPTLYLLRARQAFREFGMFDRIVVNIDETDIGDEWQNYRIPMVRDTKGKILAVPYANDIRSKYVWNGKLWAEDFDSGIFRISYICRYLKIMYFYYCLLPSIYEFTSSPDQYSNLMQYVFAPDARSLYKEENKYFEDRLLEMVKEISNYTTESRFVYVSHHPHLRGLVDTVKNGQLYLPIVSEDIARLKKKSGVSILDARYHVNLIHGDEFPNNTYEEGDPFSHLKWIASQIDLK